MATFNMIYIGPYRDLDVNEFDGTISELQQQLNGQFFNALALTALDVNPVNGVLIFEDGEQPFSQPITYDVGNGPVTTTLDGTMTAFVNVTLADGSVTRRLVAFNQMSNGDLFISNRVSASDLDGLTVRSFAVTSVLNSSWDSMLITQGLNSTSVVGAPPPPPANVAPVFDNIFDGQRIAVPENTTFVVDANATDANGDPLTYSIVGGEDAGRFTIDPVSGVLTFLSAPDFEGQNSVSGDDIYNVVIRVSDGRGGVQDVALNVDVTDVNEVAPDGTVNGTGGNDFMPVGFVDAQGDIIDGVDGVNDRIDAGAGSDTVDAGLGNDTVFAGSGSDQVFGSFGDDSLIGGDGNDLLVGGDARDTLNGEAGNDTLDGGAGDDLLTIGAGDSAAAGGGADTVIIDRGQLDANNQTFANMTVDGGIDPTDADVLDLRGAGNWRIINQVPDSNGNGTNGTVQFLDAGGNATGQVLNFTEIETILGTPFVPANQPPVFINVSNGQTISIPENTTFVVDANAVDPNGDALTYSIVGGADAGSFTIDPATGVLSFRNPVDFEGARSATGNDQLYDVTIRVSDGRGGVQDAALLVNVTDVNEAPANQPPVFVNVSNGQTISIPENTTFVVDANAVDPNGDALTYSIVGGADAGSFTIDPATGVLSFRNPVDFEGARSATGNDQIYDVTIRVSDGRGGVQDAALLVNVTDVNEAPANQPPVFVNVSNGQTISIPENTTFVVDANAVDPNGDALTYSIVGGADAGSFTIDPATGVLSFRNPVDFEGARSATGNDQIYDVTIRVSDGRGGVQDAALLVNVTDVNEAPANQPPVFVNVSNGQTISIPENTTFVVDANAVDPNGDALTYSIVGGADAGSFTIDPATGVLSFRNPVDFEGARSATGNDQLYDVTIRVSDGRGGVQDVTLQVNVTDVAETVADGTVNGTADNDNMPVGFVDAQGDIIDGADGLNDRIDAGAGNDIVTAGEGADSVLGGEGNDGLLGGTGDDTLSGGAGNDTQLGEAGNDSLDGGAGNDSLFGGTENDTLSGGAGNDAVSGDAGDDLLTVGAGDTANGGAGADTIVVDRAQLDANNQTAANMTVDGGSGPTDADTLDLRTAGNWRIINQVPDSNGNGTNGTVQFLDAGGNATGQVLNFTEIETILGTPFVPANQPPVFVNVSNGQTISIPENTTFVVDANAVDPNGDALTYSIVGGADAGSFTIDPATGVLSFRNPVDFEGARSATGNDQLYDVTIRVSDGRGGVQDVTLQVNVTDVAETVADGTVNGTADNDNMPVGFVDAQGDIIDGADGLNDRIDAGAGNDIVTAGEGADSVLGGEGNDGLLGGTGDDTLSGGAGNDTQLGEAGNDSLDGGAGNDSLFGGTENDTLSGGAGNDAVSGDAGDDLLTVGAGDTANGGAGADTIVVDRAQLDANNQTAANMTVDGGSGPTDADTLDLRGAGNWRIINQVPDSNGNGTNGTVQFLDAGGNATGQVLNFTEIETILGTPFVPANQPPVFINVSNGQMISIPENTTFVVDANAVDPNGDALTYSIVGGADAGSFTIDPATGVLSFRNPVDFEGARSATGNDQLYDVTIRVSDGRGGLQDVTLQVNVTDAIEPNGVVDGTAGDDNLPVGFVDPQGDVIDGADGLNDVIASGSGADTVDAGLGDDTVQAGTGADSVLGNAGNDSLLGEDGNDTLSGGTGNDTVAGGIGNDSLLGGDGADSLSGDAGSDTLSGGLGADTLAGGAGDDDIAVGGADQATGGAGDDVFTLDPTDTGDVNATIDGGLDGLSGSPEDGSNGDGGDVLDLSGLTAPQTVVFGANPESGTVNGLDGDAGVDLTFTEIERVLTGTGADTVNGGAALGPINLDTGAGNDSILGGAGADTIAAGDGNDSVVAGAGDDSLNAGAGDDTVDAGTGNDVVAAGSGNDSVAGGDGADTLAGDGGADTLSGGLGNDSLSGGAENDVLSGNEGNDTVDGGAGDDRLEGGANDDALTGGDGADSLSGGDGADTLAGDAGSDTLEGGAGDDSLGGGAGADSLTGGDGTDTLSGGDGSDTLAGGAGADQLSGGLGDDDFVLGAGDLAQGGDGDDVFTLDPTLAGTGTITVTGGEAGEDLTDPSNGGAGDVLDLRGLTDVVVTYTNPDPITGTSEAGTASYRNSAGQTVTIQFAEIEAVLTSANGVVDGTGGGDTMTPGFTDPQGDQIDGADGLDDVIAAGSGNDTVDAGLGNDTVDAGDGNDSVAGGAGNDSVIGGSGADTLSGDGGNDTLSGGVGADSLSGGADDDVLQGNEGADTLSGGAGNDSLDGGAEADSLSGDAGRDTLSGGDGADTLDGGAEADSLTGGAGTDSLLGGDGADTLSGDAGDDTLSGGAGADLLTGGDGNDVLAGGTEADTLTGGANSDSLSGDAGDDLLSGDAGNDTLAGGDGNDALSGGDGSDLLAGGQGNDTLAGGNDDDDLTVGAGDRAEGGAGDDEFRVDPALAGTATITIVGGETGEDLTDTVNGGSGDVLDLRGLTNVTLTRTTAESGTATYQNASGQTVTIQFSEIETVLVDTNGVVDGTSGADLMTPTSGPGGLPFADLQGDQIDGTDGVNDAIDAGQGNDTVDAGQGNDTVLGGTGNDSLSGNLGNDSLSGQDGDDTLSGDSGADTLSGGLGNDSLFGGAEADSLLGDAGLDTLSGGQGDDTLSGGADADQLSGGDGADALSGDAGADTLSGGLGADTLSGDAGDDDIAVGGADQASGGAGDDVFTLDGSDTGADVNATVDGGLDGLSGAPEDASNGDGGDVLDLSGVTAPVTVVYGANPEGGSVNGLDGDAGTDLTFAEIERVLTGSGADTVNGGAATGPISIDTGAGNDSVTGGSGNDTVAAGDGADVVAAGAGDDRIDAGAGQDTVDGGAGNDSLDAGAGNDSVAAGAGNDTVAGGDGDDTLDGGADNDSLSGGIGADSLAGGDGADTLAGDEGADTLSGGAGEDRLDGGAEGDSLDGGAGNDTVAGGAGNDTLAAGAGNDALAGDGGDDLFLLAPGFGSDTITGGESGEVVGDTIDTRPLAEGVALTLASPEAGTITASTGTVTFTEIETVLLGSGNDTVTGSAGNDTVDTGAGNDSLAGGGGNDSLTAGTGDDTVDAGDGADTVDAGAGNDSIAAGAGNDSVTAGDGNDTVDGGTGNDTLDGGAGNDSLSGGEGADSLLGGDGRDTLAGGAGPDTLQGGGGDDLFQLTNGFGADSIVGGETGETTGDTLDGGAVTEDVVLTLSTPEQGTLTGPSGTVTFSEIETVLLGSGNDTVNGSGGNDTVDTGAGNDSVAAGAGNDSVTAGTGDDTVDAGDGADTVDAGAGNDSIAAGAGNDSVTAGDGNDTVDGGTGNDTLDGGADNDSLSGGEGADSLLGGDGRDTLAGGAGPDTLQGGGGDDLFQLTNGFGADSIVGGETGETTGDTLDGGAVTEDVVLTLSTPESGTLTGPSGTVTFSEIETVVLGAGNDTVTGSGGNDTLDAGGGNDVVNGGGGNDSLAGGDGNDTVDGGQGNDSLDGGQGNDSLSGGDGDDTLTGGSGPGADVLDGGQGNDSLSGGDGADSLSGGEGNDTLDGGQGTDSLNGGGGNDALTGGDGSDTLTGGEGTDTLSGGLGDDDLILGADDSAQGGAGDDEFRFDPGLTGAGTITVVGGETDEEALLDPTNNPGGRIGDVLDLRGLTGVTITYTNPDPFTGTSESGTATYQNAGGQTVTIAFSEIETVLTSANGVVDGTGGDDVMTLTSGPGGVPFTDAQGDQIDGADGLDDVIDAGAGNDTIAAGLGNDTVLAGTGNDSVAGGAGNDSLLGGDGNDRLLGDAGNDTLLGGIGDDSLAGGGDNDSLLGGEGSDTLEGDAGEDTLRGEGGADTLIGNAGNDVLDGGAGSDSLLGGDGRDSASGGDGDDIINTRATAATPDSAGPFSDPDPNDDRDTVEGGAGSDTILTGDDADLIDGGDGADSIDAGVDNDTVTAGDGDDTVIGDEGRDSILGGLGNDLLYGGQTTTTPADLPNDGSDPFTSNNADTISGGEGNDTIAGGDDNDSLMGDGGNDSLDGGLDDDTLQGGAGDDSLSGGAGRDILNGGAGVDTLSGGAGADVFVADGTADRITDFDGVTGIQGGKTPGPNSDNDFVDLSGFYDAAKLAAFNAANGTAFTNALAWMKADFADDGILQNAGNLRISGAGLTADQFNIENTAIICFAAGTMILTVEGERAIETLTAGDMVWTLDHGYQPLRWIGATTVPAKGKLAPIVIEAGTLGNTRPLRVSPQHRMLLSGWQAELLFDEAEVLVAAKLLVNDQTIRREEAEAVTYHHMLFDAHEIVLAEGAPSESFHPGHVGWGALAEEAREEILTLFPTLDGTNFDPYGPVARRTLTANEAKVAMEFFVANATDQAAE